MHSQPTLPESEPPFCSESSQTFDHFPDAIGAANGYDVFWPRRFLEDRMADDVPLFVCWTRRCTAGRRMGRVRKIGLVVVRRVAELLGMSMPRPRYMEKKDVSHCHRPLPLVPLLPQARLCSAEPTEPAATSSQPPMAWPSPSSHTAAAQTLRVIGTPV